MGHEEYGSLFCALANDVAEAREEILKDVEEEKRREMSRMEPERIEMSVRSVREEYSKYISVEPKIYEVPHSERFET